MANFFNLDDSRDTSKSHPFDLKKAEESLRDEMSSSYIEVLRIFRHAIDLIEVEVPKFFRKKA